MSDWQTGAPPVGVVVEVWYLTYVTPAYWDGAQWRLPSGSIFGDGLVTHWRYRK